LSVIIEIALSFSLTSVCSYILGCVVSTSVCINNVDTRESSPIYFN